MQMQTLQELIQFCEERKLSDLASGLKQELKTVRKSSSATLKPLGKSGSGAQQTKAATGVKSREAPLDKETQKRTLAFIQKALWKDERKRQRDDVKKIVKKSGPNGYEPPLKKPDPEEQNFNKEENEEVMEGLMNKIVNNPSFTNDERLNGKIETILGMDVF